MPTGSKWTSTIFPPACRTATAACSSDCRKTPPSRATRASSPTAPAASAVPFSSASKSTRRPRRSAARSERSRSISTPNSRRPSTTRAAKTPTTSRPASPRPKTERSSSDFAELTFRNDFICLTEEMVSDERDETMAAINDLRADNGLEPMTPVYPDDGEAPNNLLLVAGPILDADFVLYGDLPGVTAYCAQEMGPLDFGWDLYDLMARNENGTWIGEGTESAVPNTQANECIPAGQPTGYNTLDQLPKEARVDYILVLPVESGFPFYSLTGPSEQPQEPILDISANT